MKITINRFRLYLPQGLIFLILKRRLVNKNSNTDLKEIKLLIAKTKQILKEARKQHGQIELLVAKAADGTTFKIRL
ncbi:MAG: hypothetical protein GX149_04580 [Acholeplasmataceae bacterium]|jgi:hypothetical protein|nr:hypothetical protein [Acholeplasmataceae bacterium]